MYFSISELTVLLLLVYIKLTPAKICSDCIPLKKCPEALNLTKEFNPENWAILQPNLCEPNRIPFRVCCTDLKNRIGFSSRSNLGPPPETNPETSAAPPQQETTVTPTEHPNMKLLPDNCGEVVYGTRIIGGETVKLYEFPWMVLISYNIGGIYRDFECAGSLINSYYVLTAAHCVKYRKIAGVRIGEYEIGRSIDCVDHVCESQLQDMEVAEQIIHEEYNKYGNLEHDIALLRLTRKVDFSYRNADIICLPVTKHLRNLEISNKNATIAGWGHTRLGFRSQTLLKAIIPVISKDNCSMTASEPNSTWFCAGKRGMDTCSGDSGGPLMIIEHYKGIMKYVQYGIVSNGDRNCGGDLLGLYTDVKRYIDWILNNIHE